MRNLWGAEDARDRGGMSLEMVLMTPIFLIFVMFLAMLGRLVDVQSQVEGAARDAARAASVARSVGAADDFASAAVTASLGRGALCAGGPQISMIPDPWGPGGQVRVTVTCDVVLGDVSFGALPGSRRLVGRAVAPIDFYTYRGDDR